MSGKQYKMKALKRIKVKEVGPCTIRMGAKLKWPGVLYEGPDGEMTVRGVDDFEDKFEPVKE